MRSIGSVSIAALLALAAVPAGCTRCGDRAAPRIPPSTAREAALALFHLAETEEPTDESLSRVVAAEVLETQPVELRDALVSLRSAERLRVIGEEALPGLARTAVDIEAALPGGGAARYTVQAARLPDATWRVVWFGGPDTTWPRTGRKAGEGLTSSAPPTR